MKAFVFVNDNGAAYRRYSQGEMPAQFVYGVSKLQKMGFEIKVGQGNILKDIFSFLKFKPDLFFMPFLKRKTMIFYILAKMFGFKTRFVGWMHLDIYTPPNSKIKKVIHSALMPFLKIYIRKIDSIFFLSDKTRNSILKERSLDSRRCHFIPWGGEADFYQPFLKQSHNENIISTGRENRDLLSVFSSLKNSEVVLDIYTSDSSLPDSFPNSKGEVLINKGRWEYKELLDKVSSSKCMIIPLKLDKINYCVGLSSLIEAIALGLPVIATYNPYWYIDIEKENIGICIKNNSLAEWTHALELLNNNPALVEEMSKNARAVFKNKCHFAYTENLLETHINNVLRIN